MSRDSKLIRMTISIIEQLLASSGTEEMMSEGLELLGNALQSEAGAILMPDGNCCLHDACIPRSR